MRLTEAASIIFSKQPQTSTFETALETDIKQLRATKQERANASTAPRKAGTNVRKRKHSGDEDTERGKVLTSYFL